MTTMRNDNNEQCTRLVTARELAEALGLHVQTVYRLGRLGVLPYRRQQRGRHAKARQGHGDVHRHPAGQTGDPARHI